MSAQVRDIREARAKREQPQPPTINGRPPPHDLEAEARVLAACMVRTSTHDAGRIETVLRMLAPIGDYAFFGPQNATLYRAIAELHAARIEPDDLLVASKLREQDRLTKDLEEHLAAIVSNTPATLGRMVAHYAAIVARKARLRCVIARAQEWTARAYGDVPDEESFMRDFVGELSEAARETGAILEAATADEAEDEMRAELAEQRTSKELGNGAGFPTGIERLDELTGGLFPRKVHYLSAETKGRKSTVAIWSALTVAESVERFVMNGAEGSYRRGVAFFPLEMTRKEVILVASCQRGGVDTAVFAKGTATPEQYAKREWGAQRFANLPLVIDDRPGLTTATLRGRIAEARGKLARGLPGRRRTRVDGTVEAVPPLAPAPLRLVVIDTLQLFAKRTPHRPSDLQAIVDKTGASIRELSLDPEFSRVSWLIVSQQNEDGKLRDSRALEHHLTQWIKLEVSENDSAYTGNPDELVAKFTVQLWREGEAGDIATAWMHRRTGAIS